MTTDRQFVSEALRTQARPLWRLEHRQVFRDQMRFDLITDYDERLVLWFGKSGQLTMATYTHWDRDSGSIVSREPITQGKRKRVLSLIEAANA
jgi:hypothetical protein